MHCLRCCRHVEVKPICLAFADAAVAESDAAAAKADDEFPDVAPEALTALPTKDKYAVVGAPLTRGK